MRKKILTLFTLVLVFVLANEAVAQSRFRVELGYNVSKPLGSFKDDFISDASLRGLTGELSYIISPKFSMGLNLGYQNYYQKYPREVYKLDDNQTISAVVSNTMDIMPFQIRGTYYPIGESETAVVQPYVSAGAGLSIVNYGQYLGEFGGNESAAPFGAQLGLGVRIPFGKGINQTGLKLGTNYNYTAYNKNDISKLNTIGFHAGVVFALK